MTPPPSSQPRAHVLDASTVLAFVHAEPGAETVRQATPTAAVSTVNWSEVVQKAARRGLTAERQRAIFEALGMVIMPFTAEDAEAAAVLWTPAPHLSLADRACLALARRLGLPVLTADRAWRDLALGVDIRLIR